MAKIKFNYEQAHDFVAKNKSNGFYWDGYTITRWIPSPKGYTQTNGMFKNNQWGEVFRNTLNSNGEWDIPEAYGKFI